MARSNYIVLLLHACALILVTGCSSTKPDFQNLNLSEVCDSSTTGLCLWDLAWGAEGAIKPDLVDDAHTLLIEGSNENAVGFVEQSVSVEQNGAIQVLTLTGQIKSDSIIGKGAGLNIGLYDHQGSLIGTRDMGGFYSIDWLTGTHEWQRKSISIVCPPETQQINIGMILYGKGKAWFAELEANRTPIADRRPSTFATAYISAACDTITTHSLVRDSVDVVQLKRTALQIAGPAQDAEDCFLAIQFLLESLRPYGDHHSFFMTVNEVANWESEGSLVSDISYARYEIIDGCGYVDVPPFHGGNPQLQLAYADSMQHGLQKLYEQGITGWIIDLRQNTGGNMEPMIAGLGPLFSSEKLGALIDVNGKSEAWYYANGKYFADGYKGWEVTRPFKVARRLPIAVLTGNQTGSSGEIVVISLIGNAHTRSFGQPTWGLTTGNGNFELQDGSQIFLASTIMADRYGQAYTTSITPDAVVEDDTDSSQDETLQAAINWLKTYAD